MNQKTFAGFGYFIVAFIAVFAVVWLTFSHLKHTLFTKVVSNSYNTNSVRSIERYEPTPQTTVVAETTVKPAQDSGADTTGCACPSCCAIQRTL